jgi:hypothetical protein
MLLKEAYKNISISTIKDGLAFLQIIFIFKNNLNV